MERFRVNPEELTFVERREPAARPSKPPKPTFDVAELTERIGTVQHSSMDQFNGDIAVLKKCLKSKRVPEEATEELDSLCKDTEARWKAASKRIAELLEEPG